MWQEATDTGHRVQSAENRTIFCEEMDEGYDHDVSFLTHSVYTYHNVYQAASSHKSGVSFVISNIQLRALKGL